MTVTRLVPRTPAIIILESPLAEAFTGEGRSRQCMICRQLFRISEQSHDTIRDMRQRHHLYLVVCYGCLQLIKPHLATAQRGTLGVTPGEARQIMGLP